MNKHKYVIVSIEGRVADWDDTDFYITNPMLDESVVELTPDEAHILRSYWYTKSHFNNLRLLHVKPVAEFNQLLTEAMEWKNKQDAAKAAEAERRRQAKAKKAERDEQKRLDALREQAETERKLFEQLKAKFEGEDPQ